MMAIEFRRVAVVLAVFATSAFGADLGDLKGRQWNPYVEWTVPNETWQGNPFDLRASVEFVHVESGTKRTTEMFYAGKKSWAFRFTGTLVGKWRFSTSSADPELNAHTGTIEITENPSARAHGFLQQQGSKWSWQGTNEVFVPQLVMWDYIAGGNNPRLFHEKPKLIDARIAEFLEGHGFNGFHLPVIGGRWFDVEAGSDRVEKAMRNPDPRTFEALELLITKTHRAGGMVHLWPWGDHQRLQTPRSLEGGIGGKVDQRLLRYLAARLGPIPGWSMGYGFDLDEWVKAPTIRKWRNSFYELSGWPHYLGGRPEGPNHGLEHRVDAAWNKGLDYAGYEHHRPTYEVYRASLQAIPDVPVLSEDRFRVRSNKYPKKDYNEELVRRGLYHSTLAGGVGNIWGIHPKESAGGVFKNKHWIRTYAEFFHRKGRFLSDMEPTREVSPEEHKTRVIFSAKSRSLIAYREESKRIELDLSILGSAQRAVAVDTLRPYREIQLGDLMPKLHHLELPVESDWVVAVGSFRPEPRRAPQLSFSDVGTGPLLNGGHGAMWGDVDDDGRPDLYLPLIIEGTLPDLFLHNRGEGRFVEDGKARGIADRDGGSHGAAWCDLDNDGDYDLINGTTFDDGSGVQNDLFRNDGKGQFTEVVAPAIESRREATRAFLSFDMDRDGDLDLFGVTNYRGTADPRGERNEVYRNEGNFRFTAVPAGALSSAPAGQGATDTDFDGDGDIDILAANRTGPVNILRNDGKGIFDQVDPAPLGIRHRAGDGLTTADLDLDGDLDLLLAGNDEGHLYLNDGDGTFSHWQSFRGTDGYMGGFADLDNDGDFDLYFAGDTKIYLNDGSARFTAGPAVPLKGKSDPRGVAFADFDGDGDLDFAIGDKRAKRNYLIRNDLTIGGSWLKVKLVTAQGQAGAFGAVTTVYPSGQGTRLGVRESQSNGGYLGQNDPVLHFGLGNHAVVDVVVRFLDGGVVKRSGVKVNQAVVIRGSPKP